MQKISVIAVVAISAAFLALVSFTLSEQDAKAIDRSAATQVAEDEVALLEVKAKYRRPSKIPFPEENPYSKARWDLGKALFFDPRLSGSNSISCACSILFPRSFGLVHRNHNPESSRLNKRALLNSQHCQRYNQHCSQEDQY